MRSAIEPGVQDEPTFTEAARRTQIIDCAIDAIAELGFNRASLAEIAKRARVSKSVVSYYFAGKDELIEQVVNSIYATGAAYMIPRIEAAPSLAGALRAVITSNVEFIGANQRLIRAITEIVGNWRRRDGSTLFDNVAQDRSVHDIAELLRAGQASGEFCAFSVGIVAISIRASIDALSMRLQIDPTIDIARYGEEIAGLYERATAAPGRTRASTSTKTVQPRTGAGEGARATPMGTSNSTKARVPSRGSSKSKKEGRHA